MSKKENYDKNYFSRRILTRNINSYKDDLNFIKKNVSSIKNILDYGCGEMIFTKYLANISSNIRVYDPSPEIQKLSYYKDNYLNEKDLQEFDLIVLRGVIQHLPTPFATLENLINKRLKKNGYLVFLATPNINSPYYAINKTLPALVSNLNFWNPSDIELKRVIKNYGLTHISTYYPYLKSGYCNFFNDHLNFLLNLLGFKIKYPFWFSMMSMIFKKV